MSRRPHFDLLYSNSMCRQSSMPTSILIELLLSGGMRKEWTQISFSFITSDILLDNVTRIKYLARRDVRDDNNARRRYAPQLYVDAQITLILLLHIFE
jgi:hypothetical protein